MSDYLRSSSNERFCRRAFLRGTAACAAGTLVRWPVHGWAAERTSAGDLVAGKDARLIVHTAKPAVFETPIELLTGDDLTPVELLFVRNNQQPSAAATIKPLNLIGWKVEIAGLVDRPLTFDGQILSDLAQAEYEMVLQCSGNGRSLFAPSAPVKGTPWGRGGMGNVRFAGVRLSTLVDHFGLKVDPRVRYVTVEGVDEPAAGEQDFEHSLPLEESLNKSMLALRMNGQPLPAIHGGPVRFITPGYYGTMHVKWLSRLRFTADESDHTSQIPHYRTPRQPIKPGTAYAFTFENSEPNWRMKTKCVVLTPAAGARVPPGEVMVQGVAFNDGAAPIEAVLISSDAGDTWRRTQIQQPRSPYGWCRWQGRLPLTSGKHQIWARAIDALGRGQPADGSIDWNPQGYAWNGMEKIDVTVA
jgi:sulfite oxidase